MNTETTNDGNMSMKLPEMKEFDKCLVRAMRESTEGGGTKVTGYRIDSIEATLRLTQKDADNANSFEVSHTGTRFYEKGKYKAGETIWVAPAKEPAAVVTEQPTGSAPIDEIGKPVDESGHTID